MPLPRAAVARRQIQVNRVGAADLGFQQQMRLDRRSAGGDENFAGAFGPQTGRSRLDQQRARHRLAPIAIGILRNLLAPRPVLLWLRPVRRRPHVEMIQLLVAVQCQGAFAETRPQRDRVGEGQRPAREGARPGRPQLDGQGRHARASRSGRVGRGIGCAIRRHKRVGPQLPFAMRRVGGHQRTAEIDVQSRAPRRRANARAAQQAGGTHLDALDGPADRQQHGQLKQLALADLVADLQGERHAVGIAAPPGELTRPELDPIDVQASFRSARRCVGRRSLRAQAAAHQCQMLHVHLPFAVRFAGRADQAKTAGVPALNAQVRVQPQ